MDLLILLRKEFSAIRGNLAMFVVLLILLPGMFVGVTAVYEQTIPEDIALGMAPANENVTEDEYALVEPVIADGQGLDFDGFGTVERFEDRNESERALEREEVYVVIEVPDGYLADSDGDDTNFTLLMDNSFTLLQEPLNETGGIIETQLHATGQVHNDTTVHMDGVGEERSLPEFLIPAVLLSFVVLYGMVYIPYQVRGERLVMDRLQTETSLEYVVLSKLIFYGLLLAIPAAVVVAMTMGMGYNIAALSPFSLLVLVLTFLYLGAFSLAVLFFLQLEKTGLFLNVGLAIISLALSAMLFPVGFFSSIERVIASILPTWYSVASMRSAMLRDVSFVQYADYIGYMAAAVVVGLVLLKLSLVYYRRTR